MMISGMLARRRPNAKPSDSFMRRAFLPRLLGRRFSTAKTLKESHSKVWVSDAQNGGNGGTAPATLHSSFRLVTWNVAFDRADSATRIIAALDHLRDRILRCTEGQTHPQSVILLQELNPTSHQTLLKHKWVREHFSVVPASCFAWPSRAYGNATLVSRDIPLVSSTLHSFGRGLTTMGRHAVITDLRLHAQPKEGEGGQPRDVTIRVANVHLESLPQGLSIRPQQLKAVADLMREEGIDAGIVAGDMNAIRQPDETIHLEAGLSDAWTDGDADERGFTWGYQPMSRFRPGRLDKILYTPDRCCEVDQPERIGIGLKTRSKHWASDHYGLLSTVTVKVTV